MGNKSIKYFSMFVILVLYLQLCEKDPISSDEGKTGTVIDIDGNVYKTVKIGDQWWMAENLKVTHYRNGDAIPHVTDHTEWYFLTTAGYSEYMNDSTYCVTYGRLYNYRAINSSYGIAPNGWHIPRDDDWNTLIEYLGGDEVAGGKLKEIGFDYWAYPNRDATNESGFSALPGGYREAKGSFSDIHGFAYFWSIPEDSEAEYRSLFFGDSKVYSNFPITAKVTKEGFSVRCIKD